MPTDRLLATALLGTARRPLPEPEQERARTLDPTATAPPRLALALAAEHSLASRVKLETADGRVDGSPAAPPPPAAAPADHAEAHLVDYLTAARALSGQYELPYLADRALYVPRNLLLDVLECSVGGSGPVAETVAITLGPRGHWLARQHPTFGRRLGFIYRDHPPKIKWQRIPYAAYWLREAITAHRAPGNDPLLRLRGLASDETLRDAARSGALVAKLGWAAACELGLGERAPRPAEASALSVTDPRAGTAASTDDADSPFSSRVLQAVASTNQDAAASLLGEATSSANVLVRQHPDLPILVKMLSRDAFAQFAAQAAPQFAQGWRDPAFTRLVAASLHPLGPGRSRELVLQALRGYGPFRDTAAGQQLHRLHPAAADIVVQEARERPGDARATLLLAVLRARSRLEDAVGA